MRQIILASTSPRRKVLLSQIGLEFKVVPSEFDEKLNPRLKPRSQVEQLSRGKAEAVAKKYQGQDVVIIAADTMVTIDDDILGKPSSKEAAKRMLMRYSGRTHTVVTGYTIYDCLTKKSVTKSEEAHLTMKKLTIREINGYLATGEGNDKAGGYGYMDKGAVLIEKIEGDYFTVIGLPLNSVTEQLKHFGITIF